MNARKWIDIGQEVITCVQNRQKYKSIPLQLHDLNFMNELNEIFQPVTRILQRNSLRHGLASKVKIGFISHNSTKIWTLVIVLLGFQGVGNPSLPSPAHIE